MRASKKITLNTQIKFALRHAREFQRAADNSKFKDVRRKNRQKFVRKLDKIKARLSELNDVNLKPLDQKAMLQRWLDKPKIEKPHPLMDIIKQYRLFPKHRLTNLLKLLNARRRLQYATIKINRRRERNHLVSLLPDSFFQKHKKLLMQIDAIEIVLKEIEAQEQNAETA